MAADQMLKLEVQGHTDNVGNDAYNQTLSEARAKAVATWLTHGVAADRLTAKAKAIRKPAVLPVRCSSSVHLAWCRIERNTTLEALCSDACWPRQLSSW